LFKGIGLIVYFIMLIIVPYPPSSKDKFSSMGNSSSKSEPENTDDEVEEAEIIEETENLNSDSNSRFASSKAANPPTRTDGKSILGISLVVIGAILLLDKIFPILTYKILVPVILIIVGIYFLLDNKRKVDYENR
jgi:hypothetical protein